jgi:hypothetical protein
MQFFFWNWWMDCGEAWRILWFINFKTTFIITSGKFSIQKAIISTANFPINFREKTINFQFNQTNIDINFSIEIIISPKEFSSNLISNVPRKNCLPSLILHMIYDSHESNSIFINRLTKFDVKIVMDFYDFFGGSQVQMVDFYGIFWLLYFKQFPGTVFTLNIFYWILKESFGVGGTRNKVFKDWNMVNNFRTSHLPTRHRYFKGIQSTSQIKLLNNKAFHHSHVYCCCKSCVCFELLQGR